MRLASSLSTESNGRQVSTLVYCLGQDAEEVLLSIGIMSDERKTYNEVLRKFEQFFEVRKNTIFKQARFDRQNQQEGESAEQYITIDTSYRLCNQDMKPVFCAKESVLYKHLFRIIIYM